MVSVDLSLYVFVRFSLVVQLSLDFDHRFFGHLWRPFGGGLDLLCDFNGVLDFFSYVVCF